MVAHTCNLSTLGGLDGRIAEAQELETSLGNIERPCLYPAPPSPTVTHTQIENVAGCGDAYLLGRLRWEACLSPGI